MEETVDPKLKGIPKTVFIDDMDEYLKKHAFATPVEASQMLEGLYQKYCNIKGLVEQRRVHVISQLPELQETLSVIQQLKTKPKNFDVTFPVADQVFMKANIPEAEKVSLWIGANVMLEYDLDGAEAIVAENKDAASAHLDEASEVLDYIKEQMTTVEVNLARLHNYQVKLNKAAS